MGRRKRAHSVDDQSKLKSQRSLLISTAGSDDHNKNKEATTDSVVFSQQESLSQSQSQQELMNDPLFSQSNGIASEVLDTVSDLTDQNAVLTEFNKLVNIVSDLKETVQKQQITIDLQNEAIKSLTTQVETLTAALGLASNCTPMSTQSTPTQTCATTDTSNISSVPIKSYATVTANSIGVQQVHQQIHRNMVSAVYIDLEEKRKRANNVVICGLTSDENFDDKSVITGMIFQEFGRQITVKSTRRLGKKIDGKTQNVLAVLSSTDDDVSYLISNARLLRQSRNEFVRSNIYINADLTPAEAKASYDLRCARRRRMPASQTGGRSTAVAVQPTETSAIPVTAQLNAVAMPFAPSEPPVNDDQLRNSTQNQVSESDTQRSQLIPASAGVSTGAYNNDSYVHQSFR